MENTNDFVIKDGRLVKYVGPGGDVVIPDGVTVICDDVFYNSYYERNFHGREFVILTSVMIPGSVKAIGKNAFCNAGMDLDTIRLPEKLEIICDAAFSGNHFKTVRIPKSVTYVGDKAFAGTQVIEIYDTYQGPTNDFGDVWSSMCVIAVLSAETDEVLFKVPMFSDGDKDDGLRRMLRSAWQENALVFDFEMLDNYFKKIKRPSTQEAIAEFRLNNPYSLSEKHREMYASYLKKAQKKREAAASDPTSEYFEIKGNELLNFTGDDGCTEVIIPDGITKIDYHAFDGKNSIKRIVIPESFTIIDLDRFTNCARTLESINIPSNTSRLTWAYPLVCPFRLEHLKYRECQNGLYLGNETNPYVCLMGIKDRSVSRIEVMDGTRVIAPIAFKDCKSVQEIVLPGSVIRIEEQLEKTFTTSKRMNMPVDYLKTAEQLPVATTLELLRTVWKEQVTLEDYVWIYLYQTGASFEKLSSTAIIRNAGRTLDEMLRALEKYPKPSAYKKAVKFAYQNKERISKDKLHNLFNNAQKAKVKSPEMDLLQKLLGDTQNADKEPAETLCLERYNSEEINTILKKAKINLSQTIKKYPIHYSKSKKTVSAFVIQCVVAKYVDIMQGDSPQPKQIKEIDGIVASFDKNEFESFIREAGSHTLKTAGASDDISTFGIDPSTRIIGLIGRYGNTDMIGVISNAYDTLKADYRFYKAYGSSDPLPKVNKWKRYLKAALLMSDLPKACEYCINKGWTSEYAKIRGINTVEVEEMAGMRLTPDDRKVMEAVALHEKWVSELNDLMDADRTYNDPTVKDVPRMSPVSIKDPLVERFYAAIRDKYIEKGWTELGQNLYRWWTNASCIEDGHIGVEFTVGLLVASYMFVSKNVGGTIVYCRDKWEYRGDYSYATRLCLYVSEDTSDWKAYMATGYREYDM